MQHFLSKAEQERRIAAIGGALAALPSDAYDSFFSVFVAVLSRHTDSAEFDNAFSYALNRGKETALMLRGGVN